MRYVGVFEGGIAAGLPVLLAVLVVSVLVIVAAVAAFWHWMP